MKEAAITGIILSVMYLIYLMYLMLTIFVDCSTLLETMKEGTL